MKLRRIKIFNSTISNHQLETQTSNADCKTKIAFEKFQFNKKLNKSKQKNSIPKEKNCFIKQ